MNKRYETPGCSLMTVSSQEVVLSSYIDLPDDDLPDGNDEP